MNKYWVSLFGVCAIGAAHAQSSNPSTPPSGTRSESSPAVATDQPQTTTFKAGDRHSFDMADTNHDGFLTSDELKAAIGNPSDSSIHFTAFDRNGDGRISADEWINGKK
jgi:Ca2+-binding EF-hand superfamily protein